MIDAALLLAFLACWLINKNALPSLVAYFCCVIYQNTLFEAHSDLVNHLIYVVIFLPAAFFANIKQAFAIVVYTAFQALYMVDIVVNPQIASPLYSWYSDIQVILAFCLIYSSFDRGQDGIHNPSPLYRSSILDDLWNIQAR